MVDKQSKSSHLERYKFKPGQSGNPKGRPKSILSKQVRLQLLSQYAKMNLKRVNPVEAIREMNRMEGIYNVPFGFNDNRVINIICDKRTADLIGQIGERTKALPLGQARQTIVKEASEKEEKEAIKREGGE